MLSNSVTSALQAPVAAARAGHVPEAIRPLIVFDEAERRRQRECVLARRFHEGNHAARLSRRLQEFLGEEREFSLNFMPTVTLAVGERMLLEKLRCDARGDEREAAAQEAWWQDVVWAGNRLESKQSDLIEQGLRDGEYFALVDWDVENNRPRLTPHARYADPEFGGDGEGVRLIYPNDDTDQKPVAGYKRWTEKLSGGKKQECLELYTANLAQLYVRGDRGWQLQEETPLVNPRTGQPLGIPIVHFKTPMLRPEAKRGWAVQRLLNKLVTDLLETSDQAAYRIWLFFGWEPVDKDKKPLDIKPGAWIGHAGKQPGEASATPVEGADITPQDNTLSSFILRLAMVTDTPASRFQLSKLIAAEGTLKQQSEPLLNKVRRRAASYANAWQDAASLARRWHNAFCDFSQSEYTLLDEGARFRAEWEPFFARSAEEETSEIGVEQAKLNLIAAKYDLGIISKRQAALEADYSPEQFEQFMREREGEQASAGDGLSKLFNAGAVG